MPTTTPRGVPRRIPGWSIILALVLAAGGIVTIVALTVANEAPIAAPPGTTTEPTPTPTRTPTPTAPDDAQTDITAFCRAGGAVAQALRGTVADDLAARREQRDALKELLPLRGVPAEVAAGTEVFLRSADENIGILEGLPGGTLVADLPLGTFTGTRSMADLATDTDYQAFIAWTIETCGIGLGG